MADERRVTRDATYAFVQGQERVTRDATYAFTGAADRRITRDATYIFQGSYERRITRDATFVYRYTQPTVLTPQLDVLTTSTGARVKPIVKGTVNNQLYRSINGGVATLIASWAVPASVPDDFIDDFGHNPTDELCYELIGTDPFTTVVLTSGVVCTSVPQLFSGSICGIEIAPGWGTLSDYMREDWNTKDHSWGCVPLGCFGSLGPAYAWRGKNTKQIGLGNPGVSVLKYKPHSKFRTQGSSVFPLPGDKSQEVIANVGFGMEGWVFHPWLHNEYTEHGIVCLASSVNGKYFGFSASIFVGQIFQNIHYSEGGCNDLGGRPDVAKFYVRSWVDGKAKILSVFDIPTGVVQGRKFGGPCTCLGGGIRIAPDDFTLKATHRKDLDPSGKTYDLYAESHGFIFDQQVVLSQELPCGYGGIYLTSTYLGDCLAADLSVRSMVDCSVPVNPPPTIVLGCPVDTTVVTLVEHNPNSTVVSALESCPTSVDDFESEIPTEPPIEEEPDFEPPIEEPEEEPDVEPPVVVPPPPVIPPPPPVTPPPPPTPGNPPSTGTFPDNEITAFGGSLSGVELIGGLANASYLGYNDKTWSSFWSYPSVGYLTGEVNGIPRVEPLPNDGTAKWPYFLRKRGFVGQPSGWLHAGPITKGKFGPYREMYIRMIFRLSANWQSHSGGSKLWYFGWPSRPTDWAVMLAGSTGPGPYRMQVVTGHSLATGGIGITRQYRTSNAFVQRGIVSTLEIYTKRESDIFTGDGVIRLWYNNTEETSWACQGTGCFGNPGTSASFTGPGVPSTAHGFGSMQFFYFWGGTGDTKAVDDHFDLMEFYVSGRL